MRRPGSTDRNCPICGVLFFAGSNRGNKGGYRKYCSRACYYAARPRKICEIPGCGRPNNSHGLCYAHNQRRRKGTDLYAPVQGSAGYIVGIKGAHRRVKALWGSARQYSCIACNGPARDWAYDGTDPACLFQDGGLYSLWPEFYMPMCGRCHNSRDKAAAAAELREYREWKWRTGLTLSDVSTDLKLL